MAGETHGLGARFKRWNPDALPSPAWEDICNITNISGPGMARDVLETTDLCSADGFRTFIGGLKDGGEVSLSLNYANAIYDILFTDLKDNDPQNYAIVFPSSDGTVIEFVGLITGLSNEIPFDEKITAEATIKVSGAPTIDQSLTDPVV